MNRPQRIRRLRTRGWRKGDSVIVDRSSSYGNPWKVGEPGVPDRAAAAAELAGRDLACPCPLPEYGEVDHCHAAELIRFANQEVPGV